MSKEPESHDSKRFIAKTEKPRFSKTWGSLFTYFKGYVLIVLIALFCAVSGTIFILLAPGKLSEMINEIIKGLFGNIDLEKISKIALTLTVFYAMSAILSHVQKFIMVAVTKKVSKYLRNNVTEKIKRLPRNYFGLASMTDLISRVTNDVDTIAQNLNQSIGNLISAITLFMGSFLMMFITNWTMALIAISSTVLGFVLVILIISNSQKYFYKQEEVSQIINSHVEEIYQGHNIIKVYNAEEKSGEKFHKLNYELYQCAKKSQFISGLIMSLMSFFANFGYVAVCVAGAILTINGTISFGVIIAFVFYVKLFTQPLAWMEQTIANLQQVGVASYRVFEFLNEE